MLPESRYVQSLCTAAWEIGPVRSRQHHQQDLGEADGSFHTAGRYGNRLFSTVQLSEVKMKQK